VTPPLERGNGIGAPATALALAADAPITLLSPFDLEPV
jgi:hypothetical protein